MLKTVSSRLSWLLVILFIEGISLRAEMLFERGSDWRWRRGQTEASSPVDAWRASSFNDSEFTTAPAPFWYGDPYTGGTLITGMQNTYLCLFLRRSFFITNVAQVESLRLGAIVDDGFVAWINGTEVQRVDMSGASGSPVTISTLANNAAEPVQFVTYDLPGPESYLVPGTNVIAVQVFQSSLGSSDIGFDASLDATFREPAPDLPPILVSISPPPDATVRSLNEITLIFSKPVQGVDATDLLLNGLPTAGITAVTPSQYKFAMANLAPGEVQVSWDGNHGIVDLGNPPKAFVAQNWSYRLDPTAVEDSPYISEFMAANSRTLADEDGYYSDWIEIYNPAGTAINLDGWFLSDSTNNLAKWRFPATNLAGGGFLVVFASEKDRRVPGVRLHTDFRLSADGEYLALVRPDGAVVSEFAPKYSAQVQDISYGIPQFGDAPQFSRGTNAVYFPRATPGMANVGGTDAPGPAILEVQHSPNVPSIGDDLLVTARIGKSFYTVASVTMRYRLMYGNEIALPMFDDGAHGDGAPNDGVFGATIPLHTFQNATGQMVRYSISTMDVTGRSSRWPLFTDPVGTAQYLGTVIAPNYVTSSVPVVHLFSPPNVLHPDSTGGGADSQVGSSGVSVFYDGEFYDNIYVAVRGNTTAGYAKKSHRFEFNREHPFRHPGVGYGWPEKPGPRIRKTSFEADFPDPTYMRQGMSFWLCDRAGSPATFYYPVRLQLNGQFYQLANHNDVHSEELLERLGYDPNGALYNAVGTVEPSQFSTGGFEKKTRKWEDNSDYQQLANAISPSLSVATRRTNIFDMLDLPNVINYLVVARFVQENDDVWANMSLYHDNDGDNLWRNISFDMNLSWGAFFMDNPANDTGIQAINDNHKSFPLYGSSQALSLTSGNYNRIYDVIFDIPETLEMFRRRMRTMLDRFVLPPGSPANTSPVEQKILAWRDLIIPDATLDRAKWGSPGIGGQNNLPAASVTVGVNDLLNKFFNPRRQHFYGKHSITNTALPVGTLKTQNAGFPLEQSTNASITITGVEFNPPSGNQDEEYICLTNATPEALDVSGWKLAGGMDFIFAPGTVVPSGSSIYVSPNTRAFRQRNASPRGREGRFVVGPYSGQLSARGETVALRNQSGELMQSFSYIGAPTPAQQFLRITEIMYHPAALPGDSYPAEEYEYLVVKNISTNTPVDLGGTRFTDGISFAFNGSAITNLNAGDSIHIVRNMEAFFERSANHVIARVGGVYLGALDNSGERLRLVDISNEEVLDFHYRPDWYPETDGRGGSLVILNERAEADAWSNKTNWISSTSNSTEDSDHDGMPDWWEVENGLNSQIPDGQSDLDHDGMSNFAEFIAGTDPNDGQSYLKLEVLTGSSGLTLEFIASPQHSYTIEFSDTLGGSSWQKFRDIERALGGRISFDDANASAHRYYRLITPKR
jgi:hypothetical protein